MQGSWGTSNVARVSGKSARGGCLYPQTGQAWWADENPFFPETLSVPGFIAWDGGGALEAARALHWEPGPLALCGSQP